MRGRQDTCMLERNAEVEDVGVRIEEDSARVDNFGAFQSHETTEVQTIRRVSTIVGVASFDVPGELHILPPVIVVARWLILDAAGHAISDGWAGEQHGGGRSEPTHKA